MSAFPDRATIERYLLQGSWTDGDKEILADHPILDIARQAVQGEFQNVLTNPLVQPLFALLKVDDGVSDADVQLELGMPTDIDAENAELLRLVVGIACLHSFIQVNWTGPDLETSPASIIRLHNPNHDEIPESTLHSQAIARLAYGGEPAYHLTKYPTFLRMALDLFDFPYEKCFSSAWWRFRALSIHQRILDEPTGLDEATFATVQALSAGFASEGHIDLEGRLVLEVGLMHHIFTQDKVAAEGFVSAARVLGLQYELTGALGKRTKFQISDLSQLVVLAESRNREMNVGRTIPDTPSKDAAPPVKDTANLPETLPLNDDTLLEQTHFTSTVTHVTSSSKSPLSHLDPANQPALHPLDQCILLGLCLNVKNTSPSHGLTKEQMSPYVARVISHPRNWSIHTMALLLRSRLEADRTRTVERSTLQLQALIDQMPTADSAIPERLSYFHSILLPSKWDMEKELAMRFLSIGVVRSALEIFERLEMWEHVVRCWQAMERSDKGIAIVTELLAGKKEESELVTDRGKARVSDAQRPSMDAARTAKLWCILGDLEPDKAAEHYQHAWDVSNGKSGRAMRSLGGYHFARGEFAEAVPCLQRATKINPLYSRSWFTLGCALVRLEKWEQARDAFARCVAIDNEDGESWNNLASVYLRMGEAATRAQDRSEADDDDTSVDDNNLIPRAVPFANKMLAFRALKIGLKSSYDNWRMWNNYMIVAMDVGEMSEACLALARVVDQRAEKEGDKCVDYEVLDRLVDAVTRSDDREPPNGTTDHRSPETRYDPNSGKRLAPRVTDLFTRTLLPRFSGSPRIFRACARFLVWQSAWSAALDAYVNAYRESVVGDETVVTNPERFKEAVGELEELVDVMRNLGPRAAEEEQEAGGAEAPKKRTTTWQFQARGLVRTLMGRTRDNFGDEPDWSRLEGILADLKS